MRRDGNLRLARVCGQVVATHKDASLEGIRLLLVQPVDVEGKAAGRIQVAADGLSSLDQELVICIRAREASYAIPGRLIPADLAIVGRVDASDSLQ